MSTLRSVLRNAFLGVFLSAATFTLAQGIVYVDASRPNDSGDGLTWGTAKKTLQAGVNLAAEGDVVLVADGTYTSDNDYEVFDSDNKAITIKSLNGPLVTIIDGQNTRRCARLGGGGADENKTVLGGFTLKNGHYTSGSGAGVISGTIHNCIIKDCVANSTGGGLSSVEAYNCLITGCSASSGAGAADSLLVNCTITGNHSTSTISSAGALYSSTATNCIIWGNTTDGTNAGISGSSSATYCCVEGGYTGTGNISDAPLFMDAANGNYRLAEGSPCAGTGNPASTPPSTDINGDSLFTDGTINMGAFAVFSGTTYYVNADRPDDTGDGLTWETAKKTIQAAIDLAAEGNTVLVTNGTYGAIETDDKAITVKSVNGPLETIIDGLGLGPCAVLATSFGGSNTVVRGFTLQNGLGSGAPNYYGGGSTRGVLENCILKDNTSYIGGGSYEGHLFNCLLINNTNTETGTLASAACSSYLNNCTLYGNPGDSGVMNGFIFNSIIWDTVLDGTVVIYNSCANSTISWYVSGGDNISDDPLFADATNGDFRLRADSPCIGTGRDVPPQVPTTDMNGKSLLAANGKMNMGAFAPASTLYYVNAARADDTGDGLTWETAKKTIQAAIDIAEEGDAVVVTNGTYGVIATANKAITIRSVNGAASTIIDGNFANRCATLGSETGENSTILCGFMLTDGAASSANTGAGVKGGTLEACIIKECYASGSGAGASESILINSLIYANSAASGSAAGALNSTLINCNILNNVGSAVPGAASGCTLTNCIVWNNYGDGSLSSLDSSSTATWSCVQGGFAGEGNINEKPLFIDSGSYDFRLAIGSPCLDAGTTEGVPQTTIDFYGNPRLVGDALDIGMAEGAFAQISVPMTEQVDPQGLFTLAAGTEKTFTAALVNAAGRTFTGFVTNGVFAAETSPYTYVWPGTDAFVELGAGYVIQGSYVVTNDVGMISTVTTNLVRGISLYDQLAEPTRDGYKFIGWSADPAGSTIIDDDYIVGNITDTQYYAQWREYSKPFEEPAEGPAYPTAGTYNGFLHTYVEAEDAADYWKMGATLTFTVTTSGRITAALITPEGRVTFPAAKGWTGVDEEDGTPWVALTAKNGWYLEVGVRSSRIWGYACAPTGEEFEIDGSRNRFKDKADFEAQEALDSLKSAYTVILGSEDDPTEGSYGYLTASITSAGMFRYSGALPDGTKISGSDVVQLYTEDGLIAGAPILKAFGITVNAALTPSKARGHTSGMLWFYPVGDGRIAIQSYDLWPFHWERSSVNLGFYEALGMTYRKEEMIRMPGVFMSLIGEIPWYEKNATESFTDLRFDSVEGGTSFTPNARGTSFVLPKGTAPVKQADGSYDFSADNSARLTLNLNTNTGLFKGSFRGYAEAIDSKGKPVLRTVSVPYAGVMVQINRGPRWTVGSVGVGQALIPESNPDRKAIQPKISRNVVLMMGMGD